MMLDRMEGNAELKTSVHQMLASRRLTHSVLLVGEEGLGAGFAARCIAADYLYPAGGAPAEALLRGECCRAVGKAGKRDSGQIETGIVREAISVEGMGAGGRYLVSQVTAMRSEIFNTSLSAEGRAVLLYHVERMNEESANALLKVMEEPPEGVLFLLTADSLAGVLPTIRSRCVSFAIAPVSPADCARYCTAHGVDKKTAALYSELFDGHIGTVLTAARDKARTEQVDKAMELARAAQAGDSYTAAVDNGTYSNFVKDSAGYGLAQWTYWSRKQNMLEFARAAGKSIGDLEMQLDFLFKELSEGYKTVLAALKAATSVKAASDNVLLNFEKPADQSDAVKTKRASYGQTYYDKYVGTGAAAENGGNIMGYTNSSLVDCTVKSPNHSGQRMHKIDRITPHCVVGQLTAESIGGCFTKQSVRASCNYGIGKDGRVVLCVDEKNRSWCSSSDANDQRAVTIECASDMAEPYTMNTAVYNKLVKLIVDICKRNGLNKVLWFGDKDKSLNYNPKDGECVLTVHRWFANKSCPGNWLYSRMGQLATAVNAELCSGSNTGGTSKPATKTDTVTSFPATPFTVKVLIDDLNIRTGAGMGYAVTGHYTGKGTFTITEVKDGWGKLKSGAGWIYLGNPSYCTVQGAAATNRTYTVKAGDSLWAIAAKQLGNGSRYKEIKSLNGLTSDVINAGQVLKLPN